MPSKIKEKMREYQNTAFCNALIKKQPIFYIRKLPF